MATRSIGSEICLLIDWRVHGASYEKNENLKNQIDLYDYKKLKYKKDFGISSEKDKVAH